MSQLQPEQIVDVNGVVTTRHKRVHTDSAKAGRVPTPKLTKAANPAFPDAHELTDAMHEAAEAMLDFPEDVSAQSAWTSALRNNAQSNGEYGILAVLAEAKGLVPPHSMLNNISVEELSKKLASASFTEEDLRSTFGSNWREISEAVVKAGSLTTDQTDAIYRGNGGKRGATEFAIENRDMWQSVRTNTRMGDIADAADLAARMSVPEDKHNPNDHSIARLVSRGIRALAIRDLIGTNGVTQEYYDRDTAHLVRGIGKLHPTD